MTAARRDPSLSRVRLAGVRCFDEALIILHRRITVVIGGNGAGKTTFAEALASLAQGEDEGLSTFPLREGATRGVVEVWADDDSDAPIARWASDGTRTRLPERVPLFAYGRYRRVRVPEEHRRLPPGLVLLGPEWTDASLRAPVTERASTIARGRRTTTLFRADNERLDDLDELLVWFAESRARDPRAEAVWRSFQKVVPGLGEAMQGVEVLPRGDRRVPGIVRHGRAVPLDALSDGFQSILAIVFDLLIRLWWLHPDLDDPTLGFAVAVIDELDLHLHPRWQRLVLPQLAALFPNVQFVITTHSPAVVQAAIDLPDGDVGVVVLREGEGASVVSPLSARQRKALRGAQAGSILVEDALFDVPSRLSPEYEKLEDEATALREKVERDEATARDRKRLLTVLDTLQSLLADEEKRRGEGRFFTEVARTQVAYLEALTRIAEEHDDPARPKRRRGAR